MKLYEEMPALIGETTWLNREIEKENKKLPTLIHFWSASCNVCKEALAEVNQIRDDLNDQLNIVAVHMPRSEEDYSVEKVKQTAEEYGMTQAIMIDNDHKLTQAFQTRCVPAYYVFDRKGKLRHFQLGEGRMKLLEKRVNRVVTERH